MAEPAPPVLCEKCTDLITSRADLVTVLHLPQIVSAYHLRCYGQASLRWNSPGRPLNGTAITWVSIVVALACLLFFLVGAIPLAAAIVVAAILPLIRFLSWAMVERLVH